MNKTCRKILITIAEVVCTILVVVLLWWLFALIAKNDLILPDPWQVLKITFELLGQGKTYISLLVTLGRALLAFGISMAVSLGLAIFSGTFKVTKKYVDGLMTVLRAVPTIAIILVTMIMFNSSFVPVIVAFLVACPVTYSAFSLTLAGDKDLEDLCKVFDVSKSKKINYIILPRLSQVILPQCQDNLPLCLKIIIAGEALSLPRLGLGEQMYVAKVNLLTANVLALTLLVLVICFIIEGIFSLCRRKVK